MRVVSAENRVNPGLLYGSVRFDLDASYELTDNIQARLFIQNLTDDE